MDEIHEGTGMKLAELTGASAMTERKQRRRLVIVVARVSGDSKV